ncbi:hypothetical protein BURMUCF2_3041 [Burkholderia multivorans CF2]|nr:hypothetical protein BURMUCF2_3041 [Burkholderia multivorans CF2]
MRALRRTSLPMHARFTARWKSGDAKAFGQPRESVLRSRGRRKRFTETSHRAGILENVPDRPARRVLMHRVAFVVVLCVAALAACSDDAPHDTQAADASQQASASAGSANAFNGGASANVAASAAAPLAPPVVHYPPDDDDAQAATDARASDAAAAPSH